MDNTLEDPVENSDQQVNDINNDVNNDVNNEMEIVPEPVDAPVTDEEAPSLIESPIEASSSENKMDVDAAPENSNDNKQQQQQNITSNVDDNGDDNDNDDKDDADDNEDVVTTKKTKMRYQTLIDSESEDDNIKITQQSTHDSSSSEESDTETSSIKPKKVYKKFEVDSDTDEEDNTQINKENNLKNDNEVPVGFKNKSNKISDLIDSESEEDEEKRLSNYPVDDELDDNTNKKLKKSKNQKKSNVTKRAAKDEAMKMIYSESQRLLRETEISLPYHRPKQRSLKEFLNRKKMDPILPEAGTIKIVEEKEKEAVIFFKSDSEDDDDDHCESATQQINNDKETSQDLSQNNTEVADKVEETVDKIETSGDNKVEKNSGDNGVSRKLFMDDDDGDDKEPSASQDTSDKSADQDENKSQEKNQEDKQVSDDDKNLEKPVDQVSLDEINLDVISTNETTEKIKLPDELSSSTDNKKSRDSLASQCSTDDIFASPISTEKSDTVLSSLDEASKKLSTTIEQPQNSFIKNRKSSIAKLPELKPKLRGSSGMMIDLTETIKPNKKAVNNLMDRYLTKHTVIPKQDDKKPSVSIINTVITSDGVEIKNDTVSYSANDKVEKVEDDDLNKPGVKLVRLKEELRKQMTIKRAEEWKQKEIEMKMNEEEDDEEEEEEDDEEKYKKYNKEKEIIINEDEEVVELESEPEENDIIIKDKKRKNREYDDDEAEVSDEEVELSDDEVEEEEEEETEKLELNDNDDDESGNDDDIDETTDIKKKKFSRIVNVDEDSDDDVDDLTIEKNKSPQDNKIEGKKSDNNLIDCEDDYPAPYQIPTDATQPNSVPFESPLRSLNLSSQLPISSPASTPLTPSIINSSPATQTQKLSVNSILESPKNISAEYYRIFGTQSNDKKKLFDNARSQVTDDDLLALCSGKFTNSSTQNKPDLNGLVGTQLSKEATESQLLNLCSGEFTSLTNNKVLTNNHIDDTSQDICLTLDESSQPEIENLNCTNSQINTQSLSLKIDNNASSVVEEKNSPIDWRKFSVVSSEDEDDNVELTVNKTKALKKKKVLVLSDDEDDEDGKEAEEEDEEEDEVEEEEQIVESDDEKYIDYDSDENEIIISKKDINKVAKKYVDAEAELSDSDWDSADEDEKDLDKMEVEIGDNEVIDEDQMRKQIGKIHARQQLDDDQRRVTMLKEMFFDDGDLHEDGAGRERKFKWKNIDNIGMDNVLDKKNNDDDDNQDDIDDGVNEIEWRKLRMEREKFLQENKKIIEDDDVDLMKGKILKLGMRMIRKDNNTACAIDDDDDDGSNNVVRNNLVELKKSCSVKIPGILNKAKGSFLKRGDQELARLATVIKPTDSGFVRGNNKNFIFSHISPSVAGANKNNKDEDDNSDIEETSSKLNTIRKRKSTSGMTPTTSKKLKIDTNNLSKKKIF
ncbi:hypothetical protein HCN44_010716 [Aphidius gifuensis]|uniref:Claspin-like n=1 Tax=Aphidius gifuensis TaxID=684658 RepID=A0A834XTV0_APHGI|nr:hypothetical protein HCN44_010716 [Aphidius gifuensis]